MPLHSKHRNDVKGKNYTEATLIEDMQKYNFNSAYICKSVSVRIHFPSLTCKTGFLLTVETSCHKPIHAYMIRNGSA